MISAARLFLAAAACAALAAAAADNPFDAFKGKMKAGMYEYDMEMSMGEMPGMPPGMGHQKHTFQHCVTPEDISRGEVGKGRDMPKDCEIKDFNMSGDTASYKMVCTGAHPMAAENHMTFQGDGYTMDMKMDTNQGGHPMHMTQHMKARYIGACK
jgi:hypothetical protein